MNRVQKLGKAQRWTHQSAYKGYSESVKEPLPPKVFDSVISEFFRKLNREIIVDKYEWKVPYGGGYIRIAKNRWGMFFWKWDRENPYTRLKRKRLWMFKPVVDWKNKLIGSRGLVLHYFACLNNNKVANYDVPNIRHYVPRGKKEEILEIE